MNGATPASPRPAGFGIRLVAFLLDGLVILVAQLVLTFVATLRGGDVESRQGAVAFCTLVFAVAYPAVLHAVAGQTLGKLVTGVRVVAVDGELLPLGAALLRAVTAWLALVFTLGFGHVIGGLRRDKRTLHDLVAGSRAERVDRAPRRAPAPRPAPPPVAPPPAAGVAPAAAVPPRAAPRPAVPPPAGAEPRSPFAR
jgi:uncharacterized RDD family membrane protein YckC